MNPINYPHIRKYYDINLGIVSAVNTKTMKSFSIPARYKNVTIKLNWRNNIINYWLYNGTVITVRDYDRENDEILLALDTPIQEDK